MTAQCPYAKSDMTPCVKKDGDVCWAIGDDAKPICVGCERSPEELSVPEPSDWAETVRKFREENAGRDKKRRR